MRFLLAVLALLTLATCPATGQITTQNPVSKGAVTPEAINERLEDLAERARGIAKAGIPRAAIVDFAWAQNAAEYRALNKFVVVLITAVSQDAAELPLKRAYIMDERGREVPLKKIASERSDVPKDSAVHALLGSFREDSFYLAPAKAMMSNGSLLIDFAVRRSGFRIYELPGVPPDFIKTDRSPVPARNAKADAKAIEAPIEREYTGFKLPDLAN